MNFKLLVSLLFFNVVTQASTLNNSVAKTQASTTSKNAIKADKKVLSDKLFEAETLFKQSQSLAQCEDIAVDLARAMDKNEYVKNSPEMQGLRDELYDESDQYRYLFCLLCPRPSTQELEAKKFYLDEKIHAAQLHVNNVQIDVSVITPTERK